MTSPSDDAPAQPESPSIMTFPCRFPIKIMAEAGTDLADEVQQILTKHLSEKNTIEINTKLSSKGNYQSVTALFTADSREQLDQLYGIFTQLPKVKMVL